jgi:predicted nucleic acid-binding protein
MSATADSSLIVALYLNEPDSTRADAACASVAPPVRLTDWHRVEIANAFQRAVKTGRITSAQAVQLWQDFTDDVALGRFEIVAVDHAAVLARTIALTQKYTATTGTRSLDLIHIASTIEIGFTDWMRLDKLQRQMLGMTGKAPGIEIGVTHFLSFDNRQRQVASAEGLIVLP